MFEVSLDELFDRQKIDEVHTEQNVHLTIKLSPAVFIIAVAILLSCCGVSFLYGQQTIKEVNRYQIPENIAVIDCGFQINKTTDLLDKVTISAIVNSYSEQCEYKLVIVDKDFSQSTIVDTAYDNGVLQAECSFNKYCNYSISLQVRLNEQVESYIIVPNICFDSNGWTITE